MDPSSSFNVAELPQPGTDASLYATMDPKTPFDATQASLGWCLAPTFYSTLVQEPETASSENNELQRGRIQIETSFLHPSAEQLKRYFSEMERLGHKKGEWPQNLNDWMLITVEEEETWFTYTRQAVRKALEVFGL